MAGKKFYDGFWTETYQNLRTLAEYESPDFIFADYQVEAAKDIQIDHQLPLATMWPQMPWLMIPHKWIPGEPGMQQHCLTSEYATVYDRVYDETYMLRSLWHFLDLFLWTLKMRRQAVINRWPKIQKKPDYLVIVNSFFGLEVPKDLPPLVHPVGPILSDHFCPLNTSLEHFLGSHKRVLYIAFGTHVILSQEIVQKLIIGINSAMTAGLIDGVI